MSDRPEVDEETPLSVNHVYTASKPRSALPPPSDGLRRTTPCRPCGRGLSFPHLASRLEEEP